MEPTEASNLDDQYKYYREGDLCDHAGQEDGLPRLSASEAALLGEGQRGAGHFRTCSVFSGLGLDTRVL